MAPIEIPAFQSHNAASTGKYSELLAIAAMVAQGKEVALPFGNQSGWDFLVDLDGWKRVQVKTVRAVNLRAFSVRLYRGNIRERLTYSNDQTDFIAAVLPETGTVWLAPIERVSGKSCATLLDSEIFSQGSLPTRRPIPPQLADARRNRESRARLRLALRTITDWSKPDQVSDSSWDMLCRYHQGEGYIRLSKFHNIKVEGVRERVNRASRWLLRREFCPSPLGKVY